MPARLDNSVHSSPADVGGVATERGAGVPRVMVQQDCIPHYRIPVFKQLSASRHMKVTFVSDPELSIPFLRVEDGARHGLDYRKAKTYAVRVRGKVIMTWQPGAIREFVKAKPDVLIAQGAYNNLTVWVLAALGRFYGTPVLLWGHGLLKPERGPRWWLRRTFYSLASGHLLYGRHARGLLSAKGLDPAALHVVYNSLDHDRQREARGIIGADDIATIRDGLAMNQRDRMVVFTGRLQPAKRLDLLIRAVSVLAEAGKRVHVALVGEGSEREALAALAGKMGVDAQVHFLGAIYDDRRLGAIISAADLAVFPSNAGLSIIHAMTFGVPALIHDRVGYHGPEWEAVEEGVTGFFYRFGDVGDLAGKMDKALFPEPKKGEMSADCMAVIEDRYNPRRQVEVIASAVSAAAKRGGVYTS